MFKKPLLAFLLFLVFVQFAFSQDSLTNSFLTALEKIEKGDDSYFNAISHTKDAGTNFAFYLCKAKLYADKQKGVAAFTLYKKAMEMAQTNKEKSIANLKTGAYFYQNELLVQSLQYLNKAELLYQFDESEAEYIELNKFIGIVYSYLGNKQKAIERFLKVYHAAVKNKKDRVIASSANNIAVTYIELSNYKEAEKFLNVSLTIRLKENEKFWVGQCYNNFGTIYYEKREYEKALPYFNKGYLLRKLFPEEVNAITESKVNLAKTYLKLNKLDLAEAMLLEAFEKGKKENQQEFVVRTSFYLRDLYVLKNNYKKAFEMQKEYQLAQDSLYGFEKLSAVHKLSLENEYKSKILNDSLSLVTSENALQLKTVQNKQSKIILVSLLVFLLLALYMAFNLFKQNKKKNATNILISKQAAELKEQNAEIKDSINYAKNLQVSLLPSQHYFTNNLKEYFILYEPKDIVSGDFYWAALVQSAELGVQGAMQNISELQTTNPELQTNNSDLFFLALGDCTGHGVPGSMVSILGITALNRCISEFKLIHPAQILEKLSLIITESFSHDNTQLNDGMDISLCSIEYYKNETANYIGKLKWAGANNPLFIIRDNNAIEFKGSRRPIGGTTQNVKFEEQELELKKGDVVYFYTDGFYDQFGGADGKKFKQKNLKDLILQTHHLPLQEQKEKLSSAFNEWKGTHEQLDDVSVIGFRV